jgi:hypothetical protein
MRFLVLLAVCSAVPILAEDLTLRIPPVKISVPIDNQPVTVSTSAILSGSLDSFTFKLTADLADLQDHITAILQSQLNRSDRCGERLSVERATLVPASPGSLLTAYVHYEHWVCVKVLGKENAKRLVGGNGSIPVKLTPLLAENGQHTQQVTLRPEVGKIEADGSLGELLQSSSIRDKIQDKISSSIVSAMQKGTDLTAVLPPSVERVASLRSVQFADASGRLLLELGGEVHISASQVRVLIDQVKAHATP